MDTEIFERLKSDVDENALALWREDHDWKSMRGYLVAKGWKTTILDRFRDAAVSHLSVKEYIASAKTGGAFEPLLNTAQLPHLEDLSSPEDTQSSVSEVGHPSNPTSVSIGESARLDGFVARFDVAPVEALEPYYADACFVEEPKNVENLISQSFIDKHSISKTHDKVQLRWCSVKSRKFRLTTFTVVLDREMERGDVVFGQNWHVDESTNMNKRKRDSEYTVDPGDTQISQKPRLDVKYMTDKHAFQLEKVQEATFKYAGMIYEDSERSTSLVIRNARDATAGTENDHG